MSTRSRLLCPAAVLLALLAVAAPAGAVTFTEFPTNPLKTNPNAIIAGPDGNLWFAIGEDGFLGGEGAVGVSIFDPRSSRVVGSLTTGDPVQIPRFAVAGGAIWGTPSLVNNPTRGAHLVRLDPATRQAERVPVPGFDWGAAEPAGDGRTLYGYASFTEFDLSQRRQRVYDDVWAFDTLTRKTRLIARADGAAGGPIDLAVARDGAIWLLTQPDGTSDVELRRVDPATGATVRVTPSQPAFGRHLIPGPNGDVWVGLSRNNRWTLGRATPGRPTIEESALPLGGGGIVSATTGPDGAPWLSIHGELLVHVDPQTGRQTTYVPPTFARIGALTTSADGSDLWYSAAAGEDLSSNIGRIDLDSQTPDVGNMATALGKGVGAALPCARACSGDVSVTLLPNAKGAATASSRRAVRVAHARVRARGYRSARISFTRAAKRRIRRQAGGARLQIAVRVRQRGQRRAHVTRRVVVLKRAP